MEQQMIVIIPADERVLTVLCEILRDAGYDALILESTALEQQVQPDRRHLMTNPPVTLQETAPLPSHPGDLQVATLEVLSEVCESLGKLPFGWQVAIIKALLTHACAVARHRGPPQHTTLSA